MFCLYSTCVQVNALCHRRSCCALMWLNRGRTDAWTCRLCNYLQVPPTTPHPIGQRHAQKHPIGQAAPTRHGTRKTLKTLRKCPVVPPNPAERYSKYELTPSECEVKRKLRLWRECERQEEKFNWTFSFKLSPVMPVTPVKTRIPLTSFGHLITEVKVRTGYDFIRQMSIYLKGKRHITTPVDSSKWMYMKCSDLRLWGILYCSQTHTHMLSWFTLKSSFVFFLGGGSHLSNCACGTCFTSGLIPVISCINLWAGLLTAQVFLQDFCACSVLKHIL